MDLFDFLFRATIQSVVLGIWSLFLLLLLVGLVGRMLGFAWRWFHPVRALVPITRDAEVVDAEWVREV